MNFKADSRTRLENEWLLCHPDLRTLLTEFENWSSRLGYPVPTIVALGRSRPEQVRIYKRSWMKHLAALEPGEHHRKIDPEDDGTWRPLTNPEFEQAKELRNSLTKALAAAEAMAHKCLAAGERKQFFEDELERQAGSKFTWHFVLCAADVRTRDYTPSQKMHVTEFFEARCKKPQWEFQVHDTAGPHLHAGRRDFSWRQKPASPGG